MVGAKRGAAFSHRGNWNDAMRAQPAMQSRRAICGERLQVAGAPVPGQ